MAIWTVFDNDNYRIKMVAEAHYLTNVMRKICR